MSSDQVTHLAELLQRSIAKFPDNALFGSREADGT